MRVSLGALLWVPAFRLQALAHGESCSGVNVHGHDPTFCGSQPTFHIPWPSGDHIRNIACGTSTWNSACFSRMLSPADVLISVLCWVQLQLCCCCSAAAARASSQSARPSGMNPWDPLWQPPWQPLSMGRRLPPCSRPPVPRPPCCPTPSTALSAWAA